MTKREVEQESVTGLDLVAEQLGITPQRLREHVSSGDVPAYRDGTDIRFLRKDLEAFKQWLLSPPPAEPIAAPEGPLPAAPPEVATNPILVEQATLKQMSLIQLIVRMRQLDDATEQVLQELERREK